MVLAERGVLENRVWIKLWVKLVLKFKCKMSKLYLDYREECYCIEVEIWESNDK